MLIRYDRMFSRHYKTKLLPTCCLHQDFLYFPFSPGITIAQLFQNNIMKVSRSPAKQLCLYTHTGRPPGKIPRAATLSLLDDAAALALEEVIMHFATCSFSCFARASLQWNCWNIFQYMLNGCTFNIESATLYRSSLPNLLVMLLNPV